MTASSGDDIECHALEKAGAHWCELGQPGRRESARSLMDENSRRVFLGPSRVCTKLVIFSHDSAACPRKWAMDVADILSCKVSGVQDLISVYREWPALRLPLHLG